MANYKITDSELISVANAIREKADISKQLIFPTEFVSEIENIPSQAGSKKTYLCAGLSTKPCIDTGVPCNTENLKVVTTFKLGTILNDCSIFGGTWAYTGFLLIIYNNTCRFHSKGQSLDIPTSVFNTANDIFNDVTIECTKDYFKINDNEYQMTATGNNTDSNLKIFTIDSHNAAEIAFSSFKIYQNNILLRDFIPALTDNDVACFYDNVTKQYFYNSGANELYYRTGGGSAVVQPLSVSVNGTYNPPSGVDGYAPVTVSVRSGGTGNILYGYTEPDSSIGNDGEIYLRLSDSSSIYELPDAYTCLEYLEANGNQSIDTGVDLTATSFFELEASFTSNTSNNNVYGLGYSKQETNVMVTSSNIYVQVASGNVRIPFDQNKHTFSWKNNSIKIDTVVGTPNSSLPLGNRIRLFATAYGGSFNSSRISYARIYHCKMYNSDTVIREFIPAKRNSDDVLGMYDLANDTFYTNSGTGDFIAGPITSDIDNVIKILVKVNGAWQELLHTNIDDVDVSGGGGDTYAFIVATYPSGATCTATNGSITFTAPDTSGTAVFAVPTPSSIPEPWTITATLSGSSYSDIVSVSSYGERYDAAIADVLPASYKEVEYIEVGSTAGPYIQTGVQLSDTAYYEIKAKYTDTPENSTWLFGAWASYKDTILGYYNSKIRYMVGGVGNDVPFDTDIHIYSANANGMYIDNSLIGTPRWSNVPTNLTYYLFNIHGQNTPTKNARVYYCKIWSNGNIVRTLIPCYRKADNVPGMYDVTNGVFYINYGTGSFILGPEV